MNRNWLKIIAVVCMLIDHIGAFLLADFWPMNLIGRLAFPIFALFIAEGWKHTHDRKKHVANLAIFAVISQVPYMFLLNFYNFNILFTFLLAIFCIFLIENQQKYGYFATIMLAFIFVLLALCDIISVFDYGILGVCLVLVFYFISSSKVKMTLLALVILILLGIKTMMYSSFAPVGFIQFFAIASLILIWFYNGEKGKLNLKWFFYIFYPLHLTIILIITLI